MPERGHFELKNGVEIDITLVNKNIARIKYVFYDSAHNIYHDAQAFLRFYGNHEEFVNYLNGLTEDELMDLLNANSQIEFQTRGGDTVFIVPFDRYILFSCEVVRNNASLVVLKSVLAKNGIRNFSDLEFTIKSLYLIQLLNIFEITDP